jgi:hypothetical protein
LLIRCSELPIRCGVIAHSGDLERSFRSIVNTDSGDHEHRPERHGGPLLLTVFNHG